MDKLASLNGIGDYNLIFAGNKLLFEGNVVTVQDKNGVVTDQQRVTEADKVVPNQPIGESVGQAVQPSSESNSQSQSNSQPTGSTTTSSSEVANQNEGKVDPGNSSGGQIIMKSLRNLRLFLHQPQLPIQIQHLRQSHKYSIPYGIMCPKVMIRL